MQRSLPMEHMTATAALSTQKPVLEEDITLNQFLRLLNKIRKAI